jgi:fructosamine-3-kinase
MESLMLDIEQNSVLQRYLEETGRCSADAITAVVPLAGGVSNRTMRVELKSGEAWIVKQALDKLRVRVDWFSDPARIHREALALRWLPSLASEDAAPAFIFEDHRHHLLAMSAVPQPHANWKTLLLAGNLNLEHVRQFGGLLAKIHIGAYEQRATLSKLFDDYRFFETLRLEPYYEYTASQVAAASPYIARLIEQTREHRVTLVHGDYSPKNVLIYQDALILLDYEVIHWGDPAFDIGFSMTHLLSKAHHVASHRAAFLRAAHEYWRVYWSAAASMPWSAGLEPRAARHTLACLLARVAGRSPLEYLTDDARQRQQAIVVQAMTRDAITSIPELIDDFAAGLNGLNDP